jgi:HEAT repeat protein
MNRISESLWCSLLGLLCAGQLAYGADATAPSYGGKSVSQWLAVLKLDDAQEANREQRRRAAHALGQIGPQAKEAVPALCEALDSLSMEVRHYAADALGRIGPEAKDGVTKLIESLQDKANDEHVHRLAARALGRIGPAASGATAALRQSLQSNDLVLRVEAAVALWHIAQREEAWTALGAIIPRNQTEGPYQAVMALPQFGAAAQRLSDVVVAALKHPSADVRRAAACVLPAFGASVLQPVAAVLDGDAGASAESAVFVLGEVCGQLRRDKFHDPQLDRAGFAALRPVTAVAVRALVGRLSDKRPEVRQAAVRAVAELGLLAAPWLLQVLNDSDDPLARQAAMDALVRIEGYLPPPALTSPGIKLIQQKTVDLLKGLIGHRLPAVRAAACRVLAEFPLGAAAEPAVPLVREALKDEDVAVRRYAAKALERLTKGAAARPGGS